MITKEEEIKLLKKIIKNNKKIIEILKEKVGMLNKRLKKWILNKYKTGRK